MSRNERQQIVQIWGTKSFGAEHMNSVPQRALRLLEEAIEAAQAAGIDEHLCHAQISHVYSRPKGQIEQEIGGIQITTLALCSAVGFWAEDLEWRELMRILSKPIEHFTQRNEEKNAAGFNLVGKKDNPQGSN